MKLIYPACFYPNEESGFTVEVPDLPGCVSGGATLADAISMAQDAASGWVLDEMESGNTIPSASKLVDLMPEDGGFASLLMLDMDSYADKYGAKAVRKNLTIPAWLNTYAENQGVNFSQILQEALTALYQNNLST